MKEGRARYFAENMDRLSRRDRVFLNNPVIMQGLGLAPIVVPAYNLQNALMLAVAVTLMLTPTRMLATFLGRRTGFKFRAIIYVLTSGLVYVGASYVMDLIYGQAVGNIGLYMPLLVLEPLIIKRYESPQRERVSTSFKKGIITTVGFCMVLFLIAGLREVLSMGTLGGVEVYKGSLLPMAALPAGGLISMGLVAAVWRALVNTFKKSVSLGVKKASE